MIFLGELLGDVNLIIFQIQIMEQVYAVGFRDTCTEVISDHKGKIGRCTFRKAGKDPLELFLRKNIFFMLL